MGFDKLSSKTPTLVETPALVLHLVPVIKLSDQQFFEFCQLNRDLRIERTSQGDLVIMPPTGSETGRINFKLIQLFGQWVDADGTGVSFDSSTGFTLPNDATRSPDLAWVKRPRWEALTQQQREGFAAVSRFCPGDPLAVGYARKRAGQNVGVSRQWRTTRLADRSHRKEGLRLPPAGSS